jgi:glycine/serine hydroxymethyltransferase
MIDRVVKNPGSAEVRNAVRGEVEALCSRFPLYPELQH